jgi:hypothetical protein
MNAPKTKPKPNPRKKTVPAHLSEGRKDEILKLLEQWQGRLSWEPFMDAVAQITGHRYTRQALWNHERIRLLWIARKKELRHRAGKEEQQKGSLGVIAALEKRDRLQKEVDHLKGVVQAYDLMFQRWAYNLKLLGFTDQDLREKVDKALPQKPKERTEPMSEPRIRRKRGTS